MSAFVVGNKHISAMLQVMGTCYPGDCCSYYWQGERHYVNGKSREVGQILVDENYRSVNYRYSENGEPEEFAPDYTVRTLSPVEVIKACDCYLYQSCETPDWKETEAYAIVRMIRERAIRRLPGYEKAEWGISS